MSEARDLLSSGSACSPLVRIRLRHTNRPRRVMTTLTGRMTERQNLLLLGSHHGNFHALLPRKLPRLLVSSIHMPSHANSGIVRQHPLDPLRHHVGTVSNRDLPRMLRVANANS